MLMYSIFINVNSKQNINITSSDLKAKDESSVVMIAETSALTTTEAQEQHNHTYDKETFSGANIQAGNDLTLNIANNLTVESLQDTQYANSTGFNVGISFGTSKDRETQAKTGNSKGINFSSSSGYTDSSWVNNQTTLIANNNIDVNVKENTNIKGAITASGVFKEVEVPDEYVVDETTGIDKLKTKTAFEDNGNLVLNTGSLTYEDINDSYKEEQSGFNFSTSIGANQTDKNKTNLAPAGSTTIGLTSTGQEREQITKATIGNGTINVVNNVNGKEVIINAYGTNNIDELLNTLNRDVNNSQIITKDIITGALDGSMTIDNRIFTSEGRSSIANDFKNLGSNLDNAIADAWNAPMSTIGAMYGFVNVLYGNLTDRPVRIQYTENGVNFIGGKLGIGGNCPYENCGSAITLGSNAIYFGNLTPTSEFNSFYTGLPIIVGNHEDTHKEQYKKYGPLFLPIYFMNGGISGSNRLEIEADQKGNEAYKNKHGRYNE